MVPCRQSYYLKKRRAFSDSRIFRLAPWRSAVLGREWNDDMIPRRFTPEHQDALVILNCIIANLLQPLQIVAPLPCDLHAPLLGENWLLSILVFLWSRDSHVSFRQATTPHSSISDPLYLLRASREPTMSSTQTYHIV